MMGFMNTTETANPNASPSAPALPPDPLRLARWVPASAARVLDCAAGNGLLASHLKGKVHWVAGIERDPDKAERARPSVDEMVCGDQYTLTLPWPDAHFDGALAEGLLPKMKDPAPFLKEVLRVLKPGGLFAASAPNIQFFEHFLMLARGRWQLQEQGALAREHIRFFTAYELVNLLQRTGFGEVRCGVLDSVGPQDFQRDDDGFVRLPDLEIGPMEPDHHKLFLVREYVVLGVKSA